MFAAATSFFARSQVSQNYNISSATGFGSGSRSSTPGTHSSSSHQSQTAPTPHSPPINVGPWKVQSASHKVNGKRVSVWTFDKRSPEVERLSPLARDSTIDILKAEASALSKFRHPSILEMVEPLEETRSELVFATEPILSSLDLAIPGAGRLASIVELDEVEIQKGILQICNGLSFLHSSAQLIHSNLRPETIIINSKGDWKIFGLGLTIPLLTNGKPTPWEFPTFDGRMVSHVQRSFDYMSPEYALDEQLVTGSDMYSLGCVIYAVHSKGQPPFRMHSSLGTIREHAGKSPPNMDSWDRDLQALLRSLITRHASNRPSPSSLPSHPFFSSLPISTLNFLDRSNFTTKTREEKISFMKGLTNVLDKFSEGLRTRKILPSLLEEMKDSHLLPYILPNVFAISSVLSPSQFASSVLPSLKPLFAVKEPPQNMLTLLDNLSMLQSKTEKVVFKEQVLPLVYNALEAEHAVVQEKALQCVPDLCDSIDYAEVQGTLFPRVAQLFSKTTILTVKLATLSTFIAMVKTLDQSSLTQKLVPLLSKIRTKEPAVMMATLSVQEAMGFKVDREAVATLVLPQLWTMSMGPLLNLDQFHRFMDVIKKLGQRVEQEHVQYLRDAQRIEDRSATAVNNTHAPANSVGLDFESLVGRNQHISPIQPNGTGGGAPSTATPSWEDDLWGSILGNDQSSTPPATIQPPLSATSSSFQTQSLPSSPKFRGKDLQSRPSKLGAKPISHASFNTTSFSASSTSPPPAPQPPSFHGMNFGQTSSSPTLAQQRPAPNYNISLSDVLPASGFHSPSSTMPQSSSMTGFGAPATPSKLPFMSQPQNPTFSTMNVLAPSRPPTNSTTKSNLNDVSQFDPLL